MKKKQFSFQNVSSNSTKKKKNKENIGDRLSPVTKEKLMKVM